MSWQTEAQHYPQCVEDEIHRAFDCPYTDEETCRQYSAAKIAAMALASQFVLGNFKGFGADRQLRIEASGHVHNFQKDNTPSFVRVQCSWVKGD